MAELEVVNLQSLIDRAGADAAREAMSGFECSVNPDIEEFARNKAVEFSRQGIARTHLVVRERSEGYDLLGFFSLAQKVLTVPTAGMSRTSLRRYLRFGALDEDRGVVSVAAPLIAQLGKNYAGDLAGTCKGSDILGLACELVEGLQYDLGGKLVYLECEPLGRLVAFYERNGFRRVEPDGSDESGRFVQMIRYL